MNYIMVALGMCTGNVLWAVFMGGNTILAHTDSIERSFFQCGAIAACYLFVKG
jgi:hypothetical protein